MTSPPDGGGFEGGELPRLAVIGDVPVERSLGGGLLLYRLLGGYPADRLAVVQTSPPAIASLPGVEYHVAPIPFVRLATTRVVKHWNLALITATPVRDFCRKSVDSFRPTAVLAVTNGSLWLTAASYASLRGLPLHLILHDDWAANLPVPRWAGRYQDRLFGATYRAAASRLCVSPGMAYEYAARYAVPGDVLLPTRGDESPEPRVRIRSAGAPGGPVVAYAGSLWVADVVPMLRELADELAASGGQLDIYAAQTGDKLAAIGLGAPNIRGHGFLPQTALAERAGATADALILPVSFRLEERAVASLAFPSKLADYTAIGLPVVIWGPAYSSAVRWANGHPGAAEVVTDRDPVAVRDAMTRLAADPALRRDLAARAVEAGTRDFSLAAGRATLYRALRRAA